MKSSVPCKNIVATIAMLGCTVVPAMGQQKNNSTLGSRAGDPATQVSPSKIHSLGNLVPVFAPKSLAVAQADVHAMQATKAPQFIAKSNVLDSLAEGNMAQKYMLSSDIEKLADYSVDVPASNVASVGVIRTREIVAARSVVDFQSTPVGIVASDRAVQPRVIQ